MVGVIFWALAVIAIFLLLKEPYDYKFFIACYKGLISWGRWIKEKLHDWKIWIKEKRENLREWWQNLITLKKTYFVLAVFVTMVLLINLFLDFIDRYHSLFIVFCFIVYLVLRSIYLHPSDINFPKKQIKEFIAGRWKWFESLPSLKQAYLIIAGIIGITLLILFVRLYLELFLFEWNDPKIKDNSIRDLAIAFFGTISGIGALFGVYLAILRSEENTRQNEIAKSQSEIANKQAITAEQGLITDRISKAVEGLGKSENGIPVIEVRIGALYALERIAQDSIRDHVQIMEIFCAYIRNGSLKNEVNKTEQPTEDVQAALTIIGRRREWPKGVKRIEEEDKQKFRIKLQDCYLKGARLGGANLTDISFIGSNLTDAWFNYTDLSNASLGSVTLDDAWFEKAILNNTDFGNATTTFLHANECNFLKCKNLIKEQVNEMFLGMDVKIPTGFTHPQSGTDYHKTYNTIMSFIEACQKWRKERKKETPK